MIVYTAISNWQNNTCLQFNELSAITSTTNRTYVRFERDDQYGCSSPVGFDRTDPTSIIYLSAGCSTVSMRCSMKDRATLNFVRSFLGDRFGDARDWSYARIYSYPISS